MKSINFSRKMNVKTKDLLKQLKGIKKDFRKNIENSLMLCSNIKIEAMDSCVNPTR